MNQALTLHAPLDGVRHSAKRALDRAHGLVRAYPREAIGLSLLALVVLLGAILSMHLTPSAAPTAAPPPPPPLLVRQIAPEQALKVNAAIPMAQGPNPAAAPFQFKGSASSRAQALDCLASAVYYEAGNQTDEGQRAVAQVVLNRVRHPAFPTSVCGVVYQGSTKATGCQFTFTCDGSLTRGPDAEGWRRARDIASAALAGAVYGPVGWATHYHADYVVPYWASTMSKNAVVGAHLFYRWAGGWGQPGAFDRTYSGSEPNAAALRTAALATPHVVTMAGEPLSLAQAIAKMPGAEPLKLAPSMRGDKRVGVRFNVVARAASEHATAEDYEKKFAVSDNLKWSLSGETTAADQAPLGKPAATTSGSAASAGH